MEASYVSSEENKWESVFKRYMESEEGTLNGESIVPIEKCVFIIDEQQVMTMYFDFPTHQDKDILMIAQLQNPR